MAKPAPGLNSGLNTGARPPGGVDLAPVSGKMVVPIGPSSSETAFSLVADKSGIAHGSLGAPSVVDLAQRTYVTSGLVPTPMAVVGASLAEAPMPTGVGAASIPRAGFARFAVPDVPLGRTNPSPLVEATAYGSLGTPSDPEGSIELTRAQMRLMERVADWEDRLPSADVGIPVEVARAMFAEAQGLASEAMALARALGINTSRFDYYVPTYDEFVARERVTLGDVARADVTKHPFLGALAQDFYDLNIGQVLAQQQPLPQQQQQAQGQQAQGQPQQQPTVLGLDPNVQFWLAKILDALGLKELFESALDLLDDTSENLMEALGKAFGKGGTKAQKKDALKKLLNRVMSKRFMKALTMRFGAKKAALLVGKVAARFVPILGWILLIGQILLALAAQLLAD